MYIVRFTQEFEVDDIVRSREMAGNLMLKSLPGFLRARVEIAFLPGDAGAVDEE